MLVVAGANAPHSGALQKTGEYLTEAQRTQSVLQAEKAKS
jgi:hypothetical protein